MRFHSKIYQGKVYHKRFTPKVHEFTYPSYFLKISLKELPVIENLFFSVDKFNLFSFNKADHGYRDERSLEQFAKDKLTSAGYVSTFDDIVIHTMPRILGHVFNPVSFWYIISEEQVKYIIAEVNNTFGETYSYILDPRAPSGEKKMQVSPFNRIEGHYEFDFHSKETKEKINIKYYAGDQQVIYASVYGSPVAWSNVNFLKLFLSNPLQNFLTLVLIHFEALKLFLKKIPFYGKNGVIHDQCN